MLSRSKRIFGIAALTLAAAMGTAAPAHADEDRVTEFNFLEELQGPLCVPQQLGLPIIDTILPQLMACASAKVSG
ncbi:hypothetical protein SAMN05444920_121166 [Nonomuraea solani]|uniref:Secreted protein n=2 Tax=Nonomuraea solani TaxID=1144553 RepID=A0A1H6EV74_9ACTN|nr:hypothetical protein SAMN05444920_121166 [Nonomuraea solani]